MKDDRISRSSPIEIYGHKRLRFIKNAKDPKTPKVLIQYRGGSSIDSARDAFNTALYVPDSELEAKRVLTDANYTSKLVKTPLAQKVFADE